MASEPKSKFEFEPLLTPVEAAGGATAPRGGSTSRDRLNTAVASPLRWLWDSATRTRGRRRLTWTATTALVLGGAMSTAVALWPPSEPDFEDPFTDDLNYSLLTDEFNKKSIEERLALIKQMVAKFKELDAGGSAMMAAFAAGIGKTAREQILENASRLAFDLFDKYAQQYANQDMNLPAAQRAEFLDRAYLDLVKTAESLAGEERDVSDEERLARARKDANREVDRIRQRDPEDNADQAANELAFFRDNMMQHASAPQRTRMAQMMRDMTRHFRGQ